MTSTASTDSLPVEKIVKRDVSTRELNQEHVERLAESMKVLGLIEPIVVDLKNVLLAGGHRLAAVEWLRDKAPETFAARFSSGVPVKVLQIDAATDQGGALAIEVAENEHRRDYTTKEVHALADRLRAAGFKDKGGRPSKGSKALGPTLAMVLHKNIRTVRRILKGEDAPQKKRPTQKRALTAVRKALDANKSYLPKELRGKAAALLAAVNKAMEA